MLMSWGKICDVCWYYNVILKLKKINYQRIPNEGLEPHSFPVSGSFICYTYKLSNILSNKNLNK